MLIKILEQYRNGQRGLPTYEELAAVAALLAQPFGYKSFDDWCNEVIADGGHTVRSWIEGQDPMQAARESWEVGRYRAMQEPAPAAAQAGLSDEIAPRVLKLLQELEWDGWYYARNGDGTPCCPVCGKDKHEGGDKGQGHTADCEMAAVLAVLSRAPAMPQSAQPMGAQAFERMQIEMAAQRQATYDAAYRATQSAQPAEPGTDAKIAAQTIITLRQVDKLLAFFGDHDAEVAIAPYENGLIAWCVDCPEEGSQWLGPTEVDDELADKGRAPASQPAKPSGDKQALLDMIDNNVTALSDVRAEANSRGFVGIKSLANSVMDTLTQCRAHITAQSGQRAGVAEMQAEIDRLNFIINTPQKGDFIRAVSTEAEHQRQRWSTSHDAGKEPSDWFWLLGYLGGKALHAHAAGDMEKAEHHIITTAAACMNWHLSLFGLTDMRPGIDGDAPMQQRNGGEG